MVSNKYISERVGEHLAIVSSVGRAFLPNMLQSSTPGGWQSPVPTPDFAPGQPGEGIGSS